MQSLEILRRDIEDHGADNARAMQDRYMQAVRDAYERGDLIDKKAAMDLCSEKARHAEKLMAHPHRSQVRKTEENFWQTVMLTAVELREAIQRLR